MDKELPRGLRNNNPLNIRLSTEHFQGEVSGKDKAFKRFVSMAYGYRAAMAILKTYYSRHGLNTIRKIIGRWAPANENSTEAYIDAVASRTGIGENELIVFNKATITKIVSAMSFVENGRAADKGDVELGYDLLNLKS